VSTYGSVYVSSLKAANGFVHKARSSKLLPLPKDIEQTHEAISAVQVQISSKENFCFLISRKIIM
jgi:hypothetical protein